MKKQKEKKNLPIVGKEYHFFDDGKISNSRHYIAKVIELIPIEEAKKIYGISFNSMDEIVNMHAVILAVAHDEFKALGVE